jgi:DNA-binding NarL/FixJ family response regulator
MAGRASGRSHSSLRVLGRLSRMMTISILIAEDDSLLRGLLTEVLAGHPDLNVVGTVGTGPEVQEVVERARPQVLLLDLNLPGLHGLKVLERLAGMDAVPQALVLSGDEADGTQLQAARNGARGFLAKSQGVATLPAAIRAVAGGEVWFAPWVIGQVFRDYPPLWHRAQAQEKPAKQLSDREREVLARVAQGRTNQEIAGELDVSLSTVKIHVRNILHKFHLPNRTEAAVFALREGLLSPTDE